MNVEKALRALRENGFEARWFATAAEAADALCAELSLSALTADRLKSLVRACGPLGPTLDEVEPLFLAHEFSELIPVCNVELG